MELATKQLLDQLPRQVFKVIWVIIECQTVVNQLKVNCLNVVEVQVSNCQIFELTSLSGVLSSKRPRMKKIFNAPPEEYDCTKFISLQASRSYTALANNKTSSREGI